MFDDNPVSELILRRSLLLMSAVTLAGCATKAVVIDPSSMAGVKRLGLPTLGFPTSPDVIVVNTVAHGFGLVGLITDTVVKSNRSAVLKEVLAAKSFDAAEYFRGALQSRLASSGFSVTPKPASGERQGLLKTYSEFSGVDAVLDVYVSQFGFIAAGESSDFLPTVALTVRLVSTRDSSVLMQDNVLVSGVASAARTASGAAASFPHYQEFHQVRDDPAGAVASLEAALSDAADGIVTRLT